jgi:hypothetical protein
LRERPSFRVVDHTHRVFGAFYGQVRERVVRDAIKLMYRDGRTSSVGMPHDMVWASAADECCRLGA